jgi:hypothetical protein
LSEEEDPDPAMAEQYARWRKLQQENGSKRKTTEPANYRLRLLGTSQCLAVNNKYCHLRWVTPGQPLSPILPKYRFARVPSHRFSHQLSCE